MFRPFQEGRITDSRLSGALTIRQVSQLLHVHEQTIRRWANMGLIRTYRIGPRGDRKFLPDDVTIFLHTDTDGVSVGHQTV